MTSSPSGSPLGWLDQSRMPTPGPYGDVPVDGYIVDGGFKMKVENPGWQQLWQRVVGVNAARQTIGAARAVVPDRPRWFFVPGISADRLPFAAPGCGLPEAMAALPDDRSVAVLTQAIPNEHARYVSTDDPSKTEHPKLTGPGTVLQVRPEVVHGDLFQAFYFWIPRDGMMPHGHVPIGRYGAKYLREVVRAWLPAGAAKIVTITPDNDERMLKVSPSVPKGTPTIEDTKFGECGFVAIAWPRDTHIVNGVVVRQKPWCEPYTQGVYPAIAVREDGSQHHVAVWVPTCRSPTPSQIRPRLRRLSESLELRELAESAAELLPGHGGKERRPPSTYARPRSAPVDAKGVRSRSAPAVGAMRPPSGTGEGRRRLNVHAKWGQR